MRASTWLLFAAALVIGGCNKKEYQAQCVTTYQTLGVANGDVPLTEAARKAELDRVTKALDAWNAAKDTVSLRDLRKNADALAALAAQRKSLLASAKFVTAAAAPAPSSRQAKLEAEAAKMQREMLGLTDGELDKTSQAALEANHQALGASFRRVLDICPNL
jgi:uncharacterized protein (DUF2236 family)